MEKTGESYTAARAQIVKQKLPSDERLAELAGMANDKVLARTGRTWKQWVRELDAIGAAVDARTATSRGASTTTTASRVGGRRP